MIISGIWFGISHFRNFLPILDAAIDNNRFINYFDIAGPERHLIKLIPSKFLLLHTNNSINSDSIIILSQFISINIILIGALFQAIHCYLNTVQLYGPLFMKTTSNNKNNGDIIGDRGGIDRRGRRSVGIGSSIGAHIIWNINVSGLIIPFILNIQIRILFRIMKQIIQIIPNQKRKRKGS
jgi:hypothetical protein